MNSFLAYPLDPTKLPGDSEMRTLARFRRTMDRQDQEILDRLLVSVQHHWPLQEAAAHLTPLDLLLMTMLVEQKKDMIRLEKQLSDLSSA
ncbi:MAG: hypothetical protein GTO14_11145 [Anaerolineales bacterium]|nr:hypothetical protein [Anaerolineales bacterium]